MSSSPIPKNTPPTPPPNASVIDGETPGSVQFRELTSQGTTVDFKHGEQSHSPRPEIEYNMLILMRKMLIMQLV